MIFDIVVLSVVAVSCVIAFLRGFIREVLTILAVIGGLVAAIAVGPAFAPVMRGWFGVGEEGEAEQKFFDLIPYDLVADICAYGAIFILVVIVLSVVSHLLSGWARAIGLGPVDRTLGIAFGAVRGVVLLVLIYTVAYQGIGKETLDDWFGESRTRASIERGAVYVSNHLPKSIAAGLDEESQGKSVTSATRQKLQELDVLKRDDASGDVVDVAPAPDAVPLEGYEEEERDTLERLIIEEYRTRLNE